MQNTGLQHEAFIMWCLWSWNVEHTDRLPQCIKGTHLCNLAAQQMKARTPFHVRLSAGIVFVSGMIKVNVFFGLSVG